MYGYMLMKTTLNLDERLMRDAKRIAAERGVTLTSLVEEALRRAIETPKARPRSSLSIPTITGNKLPKVDVADRVELYEWMEKDR